MLEAGLRGEAHLTVEHKDTAEALGLPGAVVLGTPYMINLMEVASVRAIGAHLEPGQVSLGTLVNVKHLGATPIGMRATAIARLVEVDGRRLIFEVEAHDEARKIGEGTHERTVVNFERFLERLRDQSNG